MNGEAAQPQVLIVETQDKTLAVVERVEEHVYSLCRLWDWVSLEDFERKPAKTRRYDVLPPISEGSNWWNCAATCWNIQEKRQGLSEGAPRKHVFMKPPRLARLPSTATTSTSAVTDPGFNNGVGHDQDMVIETAIIPSTEDVLATVRSQYLEALYISRTSLAYFAKGPLSRARAAYRSGSVDRKPADLVEFLRTSVLSLNVNDKKYSAALPELIKEIPLGITPDDEDPQAMSSMADTIRKSKKRKKISKGGLLPGEEEYVLKWWILREDATDFGGPDDTREKRIKVALAEQRARETQLQILLILEILALEIVPTQEPEAECGKAGEKLDGDKGQIPAKKSKKAHNFSTLLDLLIDRLCIWETMNQDSGLTVVENAQSDARSGKQNGGSSDRLRDFCTEVVVPL